jgi:hypothetical protein
LIDQAREQAAWACIIFGALPAARQATRTAAGIVVQLMISREAFEELSKEMTWAPHYAKLNACIQQALGGLGVSPVESITPGRVAASTCNFGFARK